MNNNQQNLTDMFELTDDELLAISGGGSNEIHSIFSPVDVIPIHHLRHHLKHGQHVTGHASSHTVASKNKAQPSAHTASSTSSNNCHTTGNVTANSTAAVHTAANTTTGHPTNINSTTGNTNTTQTTANSNPTTTNPTATGTNPPTGYSTTANSTTTSTSPTTTNSTPTTANSTVVPHQMAPYTTTSTPATGGTNSTTVNSATTSHTPSPSAGKSGASNSQPAQSPSSGQQGGIHISIHSDDGTSYDYDINSGSDSNITMSSSHNGTFINNHPPIISSKSSATNTDQIMVNPYVQGWVSPDGGTTDVLVPNNGDFAAKNGSITITSDGSTIQISD